MKDEIIELTELAQTKYEKYVNDGDLMQAFGMLKLAVELLKLSRELDEMGSN